MQFPYECCRCGMCCIAVQCPISLAKYGKQNVCPVLSFNEHIASCKHAGKEVPIGDGCCIKATAYKNGFGVDFASLPKELKYKGAKDVIKIKKENKS